jgi:hypothetical protein
MAQDRPKRASSRRWPSVEEQLIAAEAIHGSALEKLIRENQDFSVLRPAEAHDGQPVPPWLRVYWRSLHPDSDYSGASVSGGYPLILRDLHEWMLEHQDLRPDIEPEDTTTSPERS